jgi:putative transposase
MRKEYEYHRFKFPDWYSGPTEVPSRIIDGAIKRVCDNFNIGFKQLKLGIIKKFSMGYKTKKDTNQSINIPKDLFNRSSNSFSKKYMGDMKSQYPIRGLKHDTTLSYDCILNQYTLNVPRNVLFRNENQVRNDTIALDPGKRCFLTGYSPKGHILEICNGVSDKLEYHFKRINRLSSAITSFKNKKTKKSLRMARKRCHKRIRNLVDDLHWKAIKYLTSNYTTILIGDLSTKRISQTKISKGVKRILQIFSFFKFKQRLKEACQNLNLKYRCIDESYTSKTCTHCGTVMKKGEIKPKVFGCTKCNYKVDRDWNGARNIYLKSFL